MSTEQIKNFVINLQKELLAKSLLVSNLKKNNEDEKKSFFLSYIKALDEYGQLIEKQGLYFNAELMQHKNIQKFLKSLQRIEVIFLGVLNSSGITQLNLKTLEIPDPNLCHIIDTQSTNNKNEEGRICRIIKKGYLYKNQPLRLAQIVIYQKGPP